MSKKEEDSQGNQQSTIDEIDYVQLFSDDEDEAEQDNSPKRQLPGSKLTQFKEKLQAKILATKVKEYEEKLKLHAIYNDEKVLEEKEEEEEELEDEFSTESEPDLTDEELEQLRNERRKKKKKLKSAFLDEEAEVSGDEDEEIDEDEETIVRKVRKANSAFATDDDDDDEDNEDVDHEFLNQKMFDSDQGTDDEVVVKKSYRRVQKVDDSSEDEENGEAKVSLEKLPAVTDTLVKSAKDQDEDLLLDSEPLTASKSDQVGDTTEFLMPESTMFESSEDLNSNKFDSADTPCKTIFDTANTQSQITPAQRENGTRFDSETPLFPSENTVRIFLR